MIRDNFSVKEIEEINLFTEGQTVNQKKSYIQNIIVNKSLRNGYKNIMLCLFTGFGKTTTALLYTDRFNAKFKDRAIKVVVPTKNLKKEWYKKREYYGVSVINSFTMSMTEEEKACAFLIVDEVHHALGQESKFFSKALDIETEYKLGLSASLNERNVEKLSEKGFEYMFTLSVETGLKLGIVPEARIINIPVVLSPSEKLMYHTNEQELLINSKLFTSVLSYSIENKEYLLKRLCLNIIKPKKDTFTYCGLEYNSVMLIDDIFEKLKNNNIPIKDKNLIIGIAKKIIFNFSKRDSLLDCCTDKISIVYSLLKIIEKKKGELKNVLIFAKSIKFLEMLNSNLQGRNINSALIHSNLTPKKINNILLAFKEEYFKVLLSIGIIKEGFDLESIDTIIRIAYNGTILDAEQIVGRALRHNEKELNKISIIFNLYVDSFIYREKSYDSLEAEKLEHAYTNYDMVWVDNINNIENENKEEEC